MADSKISALAAATSLAGTDELVIASAGATKKLAGANLPGYEIAYVEFTADVAVSATAEATPNDVVSAGAVAFNGTTRVCIEFFSDRVDVGAVGGSFTICNLWEDSTNLGRICVAALASISVPVIGRRYLTPSNASHTYKIRAWRVNSDGSVRGGTGGADDLPGYIRITRA